MAEKKPADMSTEFAIEILKLTYGIKGHYSLCGNVFFALHILRSLLHNAII